MARRISALVFIFASTAVAWWFLGATIYTRTYSSDIDLKGKVMSNWGTPQTQTAPTACVAIPLPNPQETRQLAMPLESSHLNVALNLDYRQKGLLWYSTYRVDFSGDYLFHNPAEGGIATVTLKLPTAQALYDGLQVQSGGKDLPTTVRGDILTASIDASAGEVLPVHIAYRSQGLDSWNYNFGMDVSQVKDFHLNVTTNFNDGDFPANALSPTSRRDTAGGWQIDWDYTNLISGYQVGIGMPQHLQPGPLAGRISFFAPVSLFFFFFLMFLITTLRNIELHPMNYFFLATAFFAFHLLLAYLVDHISIHAAFLICSAVSIFLVVSYLRLVVGMRFALVEAGLSQFVYLVLFSYAFLLQGFTALAVTIGAIVTLFVVMQLTGRVKWADKFAAIGRDAAPSLGL